MKRVKIIAVPDGTQETSQVILADKDHLDALRGLLPVAEFDFVASASSRDVNNFFFPRQNGSFAVRIFKQEKDPYVAAEMTRNAGHDLLRDLRHYKIETIAIRSLSETISIYDYAEGLALGSYQFLKFFNEPEKKEKPLREIHLILADADRARELNDLVQVVFETRDLVNEPHSSQSTEQLAQSIENMGKTYGFSVETLGKLQIESLKMGGMLAVSQASDAPPQFSILEWKPANAFNTKPIVLVGKGVVYDTGGLSLKPTESMDYMKCDMAGGATVAGTLAIAAQTKLPLHIVGLVAITDNRIGAKAFAPGDVIRMYSGKTVEVMNTDAEGRLLLADALHYAKKYNPLLVFDFATLTGAAVRALGNNATCYMGNASKEIKDGLEHAGNQTYERLVELPLWKEYGDELKSNTADIKNVGSINAGMITAGKFLEYFTEGYPWLHFDIAGPAFLRSGNTYRTKEGSGVGVRLMFAFLKNYIKPK